jgi:diacylglycerol kinase (ATP)
MRVRLDGQVVDRRMFLVAVANGPSYGGGMRIAPHARPDDGLLDVCLVEHMSRLEVLKLVPKMYSAGHVGHPAVEFFRCGEVSLESAGTVRCQADGELAGELPARIRVHPRALQCVSECL